MQVPYGMQVGSEDNPKESPNRTNNVEIEINDGILDDSKYGDALIYGGGQGISYTGNSKVIINGGELDVTAVSAGGSNGYTESSDIVINDGVISSYQSANRGIVNTAVLTLKNGSIGRISVGGDAISPDVNGVVNSSTVNLLGGEVKVLDPGTSGGNPIDLNKDDYKVVKTSDVKIIDDRISDKEIVIDYDIKIFPHDIVIAEEMEQQLEAIITTSPRGYEDLFDEIKWESSNSNWATVSQNGVVKGIEGNHDVKITASIQNKEAVATVEVDTKENRRALIIALWFIVGIAVLIFILTEIAIALS